MYSTHSSEGLRILGFPSREFMGQEFVDPQKTKAFVENLGVEFDVFSCIKVNGQDRHPLYKYLMRSTRVSDITWNFSTAFVVGRDGSVRARVDRPQENNWAALKDEIATCLGEEVSQAEEVSLAEEAKM